MLPRALGLPRDPVRAARLLAGATTRTIGLGRVNGRRFAFNAGIGLDAGSCGGSTPRSARGREAARRLRVRAGGDPPGHVAPRPLPDALEVEGAGRAAFALVANCDPYTYAGRLGVRVSHGASFDLGLDLVAPSAVRARDIPRVGVTLLRGARPRKGFVVLHDVVHAVVRCDEPMPLQVDGEDLGDVESAVFESEPRVTALVPAV